MVIYISAVCIHIAICLCKQTALKQEWLGCLQEQSVRGDVTLEQAIQSLLVVHRKSNPTAYILGAEECLLFDYLPNHTRFEHASADTNADTNPDTDRKSMAGTKATTNLFGSAVAVTGDAHQALGLHAPPRAEQSCLPLSPSLYAQSAK